MADVPAERHLYLRKDDDEVLDLTFKDSSGNPFDLSAATAEAQIRLTSDSTTVIADFNVDMTDADVGNIIFSLTEAQTGAMNFKRLPHAVWDLKLTIGGVTETKLAGNVYLTEGVTR